MDEENIEYAMEIIINKIAQLTNTYVNEKDTNESKKLKEKIDLLQIFKEQIYLGNNSIIQKVIDESKKGIL